MCNAVSHRWQAVAAITSHLKGEVSALKCLQPYMTDRLSYAQPL